MTIYNEFSHWKWWFSIAMLVYQRVSCFACIYTYICAIQWHEWHWQEPGFQTKLPGCRRMVMGLPRIARNWLQFGKNDKEPCSFDVPSILDTSIFTEFIHKNIYILYFLLFIYLHTHLQKQQDTYTWYMSCFCDVAFHMPFILPNSVPTGSAWNSVKRQCQSRKRGVDGSWWFTSSFRIDFVGIYSEWWAFNGICLDFCWSKIQCQTLVSAL